MAAYEYRCRECQTLFEVRRSIRDDAPSAVPCPAGHTDTGRVFSAVAVTGAAPAAPQSGGCCGGGCCG